MPHPLTPFRALLLLSFSLIFGCSDDPSASQNPLSDTFNADTTDATSSTTPDATLAADDADAHTDADTPNTPDGDAATTSDVSDLKDDTALDGDTGDVIDSADADADSTPPSFAFTLSSLHLSLPYAQANDPLTPSADLTLTEVGGAPSDASITALIEGPFTLTADTSPVSAGEARALTVRFSGDMTQRQRVSGALTLTIGDQTARITLAAVIGRPNLPAAQWERLDGGQRAILHLPSAPFPHPSAAYTDDTVWVVIPDDLGRSGPPGLVLHLHGHNALLSSTIPSQWIVPQFLHSGRDAVLIIPQGPVQAASGNFGKLQDPNGFSALALDVIAILYRDGLTPWGETGGAVVTSHSGGYLATASVLQGGGEPVVAAHLFDSLYGRETVFRDFAVMGHVLRSSYTSGGGTGDNNAALGVMLDGVGVTHRASFHDDDLFESAVTIGFTPASHNGSVSVERAYARWLEMSGLSVSAGAAPELRGVVALGDEARVWWRAERQGPSLVRVEGSWDGLAWEVLGVTENVELTVPHRPWVRVVYEGGVGSGSDVYGVTGGEWLIVDGFDRYLGGSFEGRAHDFGVRLGQALGVGYAVASNEAVERGEVLLNNYPKVLWLLGDESTADVTFSAAERAAIGGYVSGGGKLLVSGAEVGYATDRAWLTSTLGVSYVADSAGTQTAGGYRFGEVYPEDFPDVLSGPTTLWTYATGGGAAVGWNRQVVVVGFGLETMRQEVLEVALPSLVSWLE
jgi:hypothetical protein